MSQYGGREGHYKGKRGRGLGAAALAGFSLGTAEITIFDITGLSWQLDLDGAWLRVIGGAAAVSLVCVLVGLGVEALENRRCSPNQRSDLFLSLVIVITMILLGGRCLMFFDIELPPALVLLSTAITLIVTVTTCVSSWNDRPKNNNYGGWD